MYSWFLIVIAFLTGLGGGWFGKAWLESRQNKLVDDFNGSEAVSMNTHLSVKSEPAYLREFDESNRFVPGTRSPLKTVPSQEWQGSFEESTDTTNTATFSKLLKERRYEDAMNLIQQQSEKNSALFRMGLLDELKLLIEVRNNSDFSELVDRYLSLYYDDIEVLLLLADFNQANGSYLEVVNVFLLASTYAYSDVDQEKVDLRFNEFVMDVDSAYTSQKNWWSLINLYAHINTSGLMTSIFQYRQALVYLRSGDQEYAIEQFTQLLDDSLVGESAAAALSSLTPATEAPIIVNNSPWAGADTIELQTVGNQYAVKLDNNRRESVTLLIDTGASTTAVSRESFKILNASGNAVEQERRVFHTANGRVQATVYSVPILILGSHRLENTQIAVIDFDNHRGIDGLLGMNILGQFRFHIDQDSSNLLLSRK